MISCDYNIKRFEIIGVGEDRVQSYSPKLYPVKFENLSLIEGPNGSGKSTILNIIALALFAHKCKKDEIVDDLLYKINSLLNIKQQELTFSVAIDNPILGIKILSEKRISDNNLIELSIEENGHRKIITPEQFQNEYKLIYDIPQKPTDRIRNLLNEIAQEQMSLGGTIKNFKDYIHQMLSDIKDALDPKILKEKSDKLVDLQNQIDEQKAAFQERKDCVKQLICLYLCKSYYLQEKEIKDLETKQSILVSRQSTHQRIEHQEIIHENSVKSTWNKNKATLQNSFDYLRDSYQVFLSEKESKKYSTIFSLDLERIFGSENNFSSFKADIQKILDIYVSLSAKEDQRTRKTQEEVEVFTAIIVSLNDFKESTVILPTTSISIENLIKLLDDQVSQKNRELSKGIALDNITKHLRVINENVEKCKRQFDELRLLEKSQRSQPVSDEDSTQEKVINLEKQIKTKKALLHQIGIQLNTINIAEKDAGYKYLYLRANENLRPYDTFEMNDLKREMDGISHSANSLDDSIKKNEGLYATEKLKLDEYKKLKPHKYQKHRDEINILYSHLFQLDQDITVNFPRYLSRIREKNSTQVLSTEEDKYNKAAGKYLAKKISPIRHEERVLPIELIDVVNDWMITDTVPKRKILMSDLSTGQSQSAYLKGLLQVSDKRKIIALFDEVAMMDEKSLQPIVEKMRELYNSGKLLLGLIVQKENKPDVRAL